MRALHAALICLLILAVFVQTATAALRPLIQDDNLISIKKNAFHNPPGVTLRKKPGLIVLGDPVDDPTPH